MNYYQVHQVTASFFFCLSATLRGSITRGVSVRTRGVCTVNFTLFLMYSDSMPPCTKHSHYPTHPTSESRELGLPEQGCDLVHDP